MRASFSRRGLLKRSLFLGCSAAASPLLTPITFAAGPWDQRLVVIILRGAMDGLDVVQPYGAPELASYRSSLKAGEAGGAHDLDGFFSLHPALGDLMPLWAKGELGFAHAVSTPYRNKRSHFDGQDLLEAGTGFDGGVVMVRDGWLNRMLQSVPGLEAETAYAIGPREMLVLSGDAPISRWSPEARLELSPQARRLVERVSHDDALFRDAVTQALDIVESIEDAAATAEAMGDEAGAEMMMGKAPAARGKPFLKVADFAASRLRGASRIAAFSLNGWDTHNNQAGSLRGPLAQLSKTILALRDGLGPVWGQTTVLAMTEFGRTVRENGSHGTDHGTGGAMLLAGGAVRGGKVYSDWPGLAELDLYQNRDLTPTADVRAYAAAAMQGLFGLDRAVLESSVFPGLDMALAPRVIL